MTTLPIPAQYLLRVDDLCPTVHAGRWRRLRGLIGEFGIRPILAVVPDNLDPELAASAPDAVFWPQMRELEAAGATVALHGYQHLCTNKGRGLIPLHRTTEFAGVSFERQRQWMANGLAILRSHGLNPQLWVAPRHGFDRNTLRALRHLGLTCLSDGLARIPLRRGGMLWIPQQLWSAVPKSEGMWTICIHPNTIGDEGLAGLRDFFSQYATQFTSVDRVIRDYATSAASPWECVREIALLGDLSLRSMLARRGRR